jgi:hypothetical protein
MPDQKIDLLPTSRIISIAQEKGVNFGKGNPHERIRYFIKAGLLPHTQKRTVFSDKLKPELAGHLPLWSVDRLVHLQSLLDQGFTVTEIKKNFDSGLTELHSPQHPWNGSQQIPSSLNTSEGINVDQNPVAPTTRPAEMALID